MLLASFLPLCMTSGDDDDDEVGVVGVGVGVVGVVGTCWALLFVVAGFTTKFEEEFGRSCGRR